MKSKTLVFATLLLVTAFLLTQAIAPHAALAASGWTNTDGGVSSYDICSLTYDSVHNLLYAGSCIAVGSTGYGVWQYDGTNWTNMGGGVSSYYISSLAYDSVHNLLYAGTWNHGVWVYSGTNWTDTGGGVAGYEINSLAYDSVHNLLYAGTGLGHGAWVYNGTNWINTEGGVSSYIIGPLAYDSGHNLLYAGCCDFATGAGRGVWKYDGTTWSSTGGGVSSNWIYSLAYDSVHKVLYAGTVGGQGVFKYDGTTWTSTGGGVSSYNIASLAYDSVHKVLYAGMDHGVWKYNGTSWTNTGGAVSTYGVGALTYDSVHDLLYAGCCKSTGAGYGVWKYDASAPMLPSTFYFAEGTCRPNFDPYFCIQNPGKKAASVKVTYMKGDGTTQIQTITVNPSSRSTVAVSSVLGVGNDASHDFSSKVECTNGQQIIAERSMYFNYQGVWTGGDGVVGATSPASTFYFAEGTCRPNFDPYLCIQNPGAGAATVKITYMKGNKTTQSQTTTVSKNSRSTVRVKDVLGEGNDSAHDFSCVVSCTNGQQIIAERPMYFNYQGFTNLDWTGGSDVVGATSPASTFYFAEGTTRPNFDPYICIQNPGQSDANVTITYMKGDGTTAAQKLTVSAATRATVHPADLLGVGNGPAYDFSSVVACTNGQKIIAERPMYFDYHGVWTGGDDVVGATSAASTFYFAEGTCRPNFDPWLCIQNPGKTVASVKITYMRGDGTTKGLTISVNPNSRSTVHPADQLGVGNVASYDFSTVVECTNGQQIIAERPMYFNYNGVWTGGHDVVGFVPQ